MRRDKWFSADAIHLSMQELVIAMGKLVQPGNLSALGPSIGFPVQ